MLFNLLVPLADDYIVFNLFRYLTFRTGGAIMTALLVSFLCGPAIINWLKSAQNGNTPVREDVPEGHLKKVGTPTMGGFLILLAISISTLLWADLRNGYVWVVLLVTIGFGAVGFADDYLKLTGHRWKGLPGRVKLILEIIIAAVAAYWVMVITPAPLADGLVIPFFKDVLINLGWFFIPFAIFVMVGASNAVNLTDGLDGLAIVPVMIAAACFGFIAYLVGNSVYSATCSSITSSVSANCRLLRRPGGRKSRVPLVQRAARNGVYGRYGFALSGWRARCDQRRHETRGRPGYYWRAVRFGNGVRHRPGRLL